MDKTEKSKNQDVPPDKKDKSDLTQSSGKVSNSNKESTSTDNNKNDKDMEVHVKHQNHQGSSIKIFLYEFFIIFLAVSVSFFVENIRDRYIEHHKEMQYIKSLINDVKLDTTSLTSLIKANREQVKGIDTLLKEMENPNSKRIVNYLYHYSFKYLFNLQCFDHTDRTITQLKNAGGLRLIDSKASSDSIISYYSSVQNIEINGDICIKVLLDMIKQEKELLDFKVVRINNYNNLLINPNLKLLNSDPKKIDLFYNECVCDQGSIGGYLALLVKLKSQATQLLVTLNKEYNLK